MTGLDRGPSPPRASSDAVFATTVLWPDAAEFDDPDPAAKTFAVLAGATLLVPAVVCWVGSAVVARLDTLVTRGKG